MTQTIASLWNGKIAPCGQCGAQDIEANHLIDLMERNRESLLRELTDAQKDPFKSISIVQKITCFGCWS